MNTPQRLVYQFHEATGAGIGETPAIRNWRLRYGLIAEEAEKFRQACAVGDLIGAADAICDLLYVVNGAGVEFGLDLEPLFGEVHRSNMTKIGGRKREDGKILKPRGYRPPDLAPLIEEQEHWGHVRAEHFAEGCGECDFEAAHKGIEPEDDTRG